MFFVLQPFQFIVEEMHRNGGVTLSDRDQKKISKIQTDILKICDTCFPIEENIRCLTWLTEKLETENALEKDKEHIIPPFATCIPKKDFHVMYYNVQSSDRQKILKVVVGQYLCEIPLEITVPNNYESMCVVIIALPVIDKETTSENIKGVKVILYQDFMFDIPHNYLRNSSNTLAPSTTLGFFNELNSTSLSTKKTQ